MPDPTSNWHTALEARDRDLVNRVRAVIEEHYRTWSAFPSLAQILQAIAEGR